MATATLKYDYSTKNFHRFAAIVPHNVVNEVYIPRSVMAKPKAEVSIDVSWNLAAPDTLEKVKMEKARG